MADEEVLEDEESVEAQDGEEVGAQAAVTPNPHAPVTPLTTPCTLKDLRNWVNSVDALIVDSTSAVTATATSVKIA